MGLRKYSVEWDKIAAEFMGLARIWGPQRRTAYGQILANSKKICSFSITWSLLAQQFSVVLRFMSSFRQHKQVSAITDNENFYWTICGACILNSVLFDIHSSPTPIHSHVVQKQFSLTKSSSKFIIILLRTQAHRHQGRCIVAEKRSSAIWRVRIYRIKPYLLMFTRSWVTVSKQNDWQNDRQTAPIA